MNDGSRLVLGVAKLENSHELAQHIDSNVIWSFCFFGELPDVMRCQIDQELHFLLAEQHMENALKRVKEMPPEMFPEKRKEEIIEEMKEGREEIVKRFK